MLVGATWKEPVEGWVDNFTVPRGQSLEMAKGFCARCPAMAPNETRHCRSLGFDRQFNFGVSLVESNVGVNWRHVINFKKTLATQN